MLNEPVEAEKFRAFPASTSTGALDFGSACGACSDPGSFCWHTHTGFMLVDRSLGGVSPDNFTKLSNLAMYFVSPLQNDNLP